MDDHDIIDDLEPFPPHVGDQWVEYGEQLRRTQREESATDLEDISDDSGSYDHRDDDGAAGSGLGPAASVPTYVTTHVHPLC